MLNSRWIEETKTLIKRQLFNTPTARQALGYQEIADYLEGKIDSLETLKEKIVVKTGRYAKKQRTWFKNQHPRAFLINPAKITNEQLIARILNEAQI